MIVRNAVRAAIRSHGSNELSIDVNRFDGGFDEAGSLKCSADGLCGMRQLRPPRAYLQQQGRECEEVLWAHESHLDIGGPAQAPLEVSHRRYAAESAAEDDNTHVPSRWPDHFEPR